MLGAPIPTNPPEFYIDDITEVIFGVMCEADKDPKHWLRSAIAEKFGSCPDSITDATDESEELNEFVEQEIKNDLSDPDL